MTEEFKRKVEAILKHFCKVEWLHVLACKTAFRMLFNVATLNTEVEVVLWSTGVCCTTVSVKNHIVKIVRAVNQDNSNKNAYLRQEAVDIVAPNLGKQLGCPRKHEVTSQDRL